MSSQRVKRLGLTGNIGSGKSTVAEMLVEHGAALIAADVLAREATADPQVLRAIEDTFGPEFLREGRLERAKLAEKVFHDEEARHKLNGIVHPWVRKRSDQLIAELEASQNPPPVIVLDIPLLYEGGLERTVDAVIVVTASLDTRIQRVMARSGLSFAEVRARDAAQMPLEEKVAMADYVVDNDGDLESLRTQVERLWRELAG
jgi:dephospho-CoA kinase